MKDELGIKLLNIIKDDKLLLLKFKTILVDNNNYEMAAELRRIEKDLYPISEENAKLIDNTNTIKNLFRMADLNVPNRETFIILALINKHKKRKDNINLKDLAIIKAKSYELFGN